MLELEIKKASRNVKRLRAEIGLAHENDLLQIAELTEELEAATEHRSSLGKKLIAEDQAREARAAEQLRKRRQAGEQAVAALQKMLPVFTERVATAFELLGSEYAQILDAAAAVKTTNMAMRSRGQSAVSTMKLEPDHLQKLMKQACREYLGAETAEIFLPLSDGKPFDIVAAGKGLE